VQPLIASPVTARLTSSAASGWRRFRVTLAPIDRPHDAGQHDSGRRRSPSAPRGHPWRTSQVPCRGYKCLARTGPGRPRTTPRIRRGYTGSPSNPLVGPKPVAIRRPEDTMIHTIPLLVGLIPVSPSGAFRCRSTLSCVGQPRHFSAASSPSAAIAVLAAI